MLGHNSFAEGTGVVTGIAANGDLITTDIATLEVGDVILANDELNPNGEPHYALVTAVSSRTVYELHALTYVDDAGNVEALQTTADHELYARTLTGQAGWRKAHTLQAGDQLLQPDGTWATVTGNTLELAPEGVTVYNLSVSDGSTYFVDDGQGNASAVWVHNCNGVPKSLLRSAANKLFKKEATVYVAFRGKQVVYVGITKQHLGKRLLQHNSFWGGNKNFLRLEPLKENLTRRQARAIEQALIEKYTLGKLDNKINSISRFRSWYQDAVGWGRLQLPSILKQL